MRILIIAFAFVGIIVGAAFASGRESLQFYTSFGLVGGYGVVLATIFYVYCGMMLVLIGKKLKTKNYIEAILMISGPYLGKIIDYVIIFTMITTGIGMLAGGGAILQQHFGIPFWIGSLVMTSIVAATIMLKVQKVVIAIGFLTPVLILVLLIVCINSLITLDGTLLSYEDKVLATKATLPESLPNWWIAALNHVSFNITVGAGMAIVMGETVKSNRDALLGGALGGFLVGAILLLGHFTIISKVDLITFFDNTGTLQVVDMPLLKIAYNFSPTLSLIMVFLIFGMIYNTAVSMFYVFVARFVTMETLKANIIVIIVLAFGFAVSFVGFTQMVGVFYPLIGYVGVALVLMLFYAPFKLKKLKKQDPSLVH